MKLLAFTEADDHVCYRYRIAAFAEALALRGWSLEVCALARNTLARTLQLRRAAAADAVILQRKLLPLWQIRLLRNSARRLIYDFDDALFHRDSYARKGPSSVIRLAHFWATIYAADAITAGNAYLVRQAAQYVESARVHHLPTCVRPDRYRPALHARTAAAVRLVWIGQESTLPCLDHAQGIWAAVGRRLPGIELRVICNRFPRLEGVRVVGRAWSSAGEADELAECDVGLSWLPDDPWSLGKCGLKVLQYMAAGLPVVANPVGMNRVMVRHGETGFLAATADEWAEAVDRLAADPRLRQRMGAAAREWVARHYSTGRWAGTFVELVTGAPATAGSEAASPDARGELPARHLSAVGPARLAAPAEASQQRACGAHR